MKLRILLLMAMMVVGCSKESGPANLPSGRAQYVITNHCMFHAHLHSGGFQQMERDGTVTTTSAGYLSWRYYTCPNGLDVNVDDDEWGNAIPPGEPAK